MIRDLFDSAKAAEFQSKPGFLAYLLYLPGMHGWFANHIRATANEISDLTRDNLTIFFVDPKIREIDEELVEIEFGEPERRLDWMVLGGQVRPHPQPTITTRTERRIVIDLCDHFLNSDQLPCLIFFDRFESRDFYVFNFKGMSEADISSFFTSLSSEVKRIWSGTPPIHPTENMTEIRRQKFIELAPFLNRRKFMKLVGRLPVGAIIASAASRIASKAF